MTDTLQRRRRGPAPKKRPEWVIVETLGIDAGEEPAVVAEGGNDKDFSRLDRQKWAIARSPYEGVHLSQVAKKTIAKVVAKRGVVFEEEVIPNVGQQDDLKVTIIADPVFSPHGEVFGVQLWIGQTGETIPGPRTVGSFEWDYQTQETEHGPGTEQEIFGIDPADGGRGIQEVWNFFTAFDRFEEYEQYVRDFAEGTVDPGASFAAEVSVKRADKEGSSLLTFMTVRARQTERGKRIVGLVHDITSDTKSPKRDLDRETVRTAAALIADASPEPVGVCHLTLATGLFLDWYHAPPGPLARWANQVPMIHPKSQEEFLEARNALREGKTSGVDLVLFVRFREDEGWIPADLKIMAVGRGETVSQGLVQARLGHPPLLW